MESRLSRIADCAQCVADCARKAIESSSATNDMNALHDAMVAYRAAAVHYMTHPSIADYLRADALKYSGDTRDAIERIAELIDRLTESD